MKHHLNLRILGDEIYRECNAQILTKNIKNDMVKLVILESFFSASQESKILTTMNNNNICNQFFFLSLFILFYSYDVAFRALHGRRAILQISERVFCECPLYL